MRSLLSKEQELEIENKKKMKVKVLGLFLLFILAVSSIGYAFISSDNKSNQANNELKEGQIIEQNGRWVAKLGEQIVSFSNSPEDAANISDTSTTGISDYYQKNLYYVDSQNALYYELSQNIGLYAGGMRQACYGPCSDNLPEKNCSSNMIIWNRNSTINRVYQQDKCVFIEGDRRAVSAFLYKVFGLKK